MTTTTAIPDSALTPDPSATDAPTFGPCEQCGALPHAAPEGVNAVTGDPNWVYNSCFACGFKTGVDQVTMQADAATFAAFKKFYAEQEALKHPTLNAPDPAIEAQLRAELDALKAQLADSSNLPGGTVATATADPTAFTPASQPSIPDQPPSGSV